MSIIKNKYVQLFFSLFMFSFVNVIAKLAGAAGFGIEFILLLGLQYLILGVYAIMWQQILKKFTLITATASKGVIVVLNLLWAALIFNEHIDIFNIIGSAVIIIGIYIVATGEVVND